MIVVIEPRRMALACAVGGHRRAIHQQNVHATVVVVVERGSATALGFNDVELFLAAARQTKINSRGVRDVNEQRWICRGSLRARLLRGHPRLCPRTFILWRD